MTTIVQAKTLKTRLSVKVWYRTKDAICGHGDRIVYKKCPAKGKPTMRLTRDLAYIMNCESVYVIGTIDAPLGATVTQFEFSTKSRFHW